MTEIEIAKGAGEAAAGIAAAAGAFLPDPLEELGLSTAFLVLIIVFHGACIGRLMRFFSRRFARFSHRTAMWRITGVTALTIALMVTIHLVETLLWTLPIWQLGIIPNLRDAYYYVLEAYTTLGEGSVSLPDPWRLAGPVIAISGLFTFGWTTGVLVYVMNEIGKLHTQSSHEEAGKGACE